MSISVFDNPHGLNAYLQISKKKNAIVASIFAQMMYNDCDTHA